MSGSGVTMSISLLEVAHLTDLIEQFVELLSTGSTSDPAVARLVPDAYRGDPEAAQEFRGLTQDDLLTRRSEDARIVLASLLHDGEPVRIGTLDRVEAERELVVRVEGATTNAWLRTLAALRLVMAERLGVTDESDDRSDDARYSVYEWLAYRLEGLVQALDS